MKLFISFLLILLGIARFNFAQSTPPPSTLNTMSNVFSISAEGGITLPFTDYITSKIGYNVKGSLEYLLPSGGIGNFGLRVFGAAGSIAGRDVPYPVLNPTNEFSTKINMLGGEALYILSLNDAVYPWAGVGLSKIWHDPKDANGTPLPNDVTGHYNKFMVAYNADLGVRFILSNSMSFNINAGVVLGNEDYLDGIKEALHNDMYYTLNVGLTYYFGRVKDSDGDGVPDSRDLCPETPPGVKVDENGCPTDSDGDGVPDYLDNCPDTPHGVAVDSHGCPLDSDGDGVPDYLDKCPNTPHGVQVDKDGCPLDSDGDGVPDYLDRCPNTPKGTKVDADGCPIVKVIKEEVKHFTLNGDANFDFGKADLLPAAFSVLDKLADVMKNNPKYKWLVEGYTDSRGSDAFNMKLSEKRAQAVVNYFVGKGINRNIFTIKAFGKANPVADNKTDEGRAKNRRVEIKVIK